MQLSNQYTTVQTSTVVTPVTETATCYSSSGEENNIVVDDSACIYIVQKHAHSSLTAILQVNMDQPFDVFPTLAGSVA